MDDESDSYGPRTVEEVFQDFKGRRNALIKALTTDYKEFFKKCDPEKDNLCLYGHPTEEWEVNMPVEEVPPEIPEPVLGINFNRDGLDEQKWLYMVASHSDSWILAVAFYFGARVGFDKADRKRLFTMINDLPTILDVVRGIDKKQGKEKPSVSNNHISNKSKSNSKAKRAKATKSNDEDDEEQGDTPCGACGDSKDNGFWICCDACEKWFHGKCVKITPSRAQHIKQYKCPSCSNKRAKH